MDSKPEDPMIDSGTRQRKFGLPDWMVNNIERLNFVTDFEQYACSPPETEGFLADYKEGQDLPQLLEPHCPVVEPKAVQETSNKKLIPTNFEAEMKSTKIIINHVDHLPPFHHSLNSIKTEDLSSPDSTPCATPEPSPLVRRKISNPTDTVITNPGRWFYLGKINKPKKNLKEELDLKNKENKIKCDERSISAISRDALMDSRKNGIKLMISNFDLNAVGPTSW